MTNSTWVMIVCAAFYIVIAVLAGIERNWWRVLYYLGALLITVAVLGMGFGATTGAEDGRTDDCPIGRCVG